MLRIRLARTGTRNQPHYRLVVADARAPRDGAFVDIVGHYDPRTDPPTLVVHEDRVRRWLGQGARPSEAAAKLLRRQGVLEKVAAP